MLSNDITVSSAIVLESLWETAYTMFVAELFEQSENARITQHWLIQCWVILRWKNQRNKIKTYVKIYKLLIESIRFRNSKVSVKPSPAKTNRQAPTSLPVCLIIIIVFFGKIHPFPKCSLAFSVALVQKQIAVWIIKLFRLFPLLEKCGFYNLKYPTVEIFARCGTICFYAVQGKISKEIFLVHRITVF